MIADDRRPGLDRRERLARLAPSLDQAAAHHRIFDPAGAVEIPAIGRAARAAARLVVGHAGTRARIVGLLRLPGDDAALDVDLPATGAGAIHPVGRAHDLVVLPTLPVAFLPHAVFIAQFAKTIGERPHGAAKGKSAVQESGSCHLNSPALRCHRRGGLLPAAGTIVHSLSCWSTTSRDQSRHLRDRLFGRCDGRPSAPFVGADTAHFIFQPQAVVLFRPVDVDGAFTHGLEGAFHADGADIDVAKHGGDEQHRYHGVDHLGILHGVDGGAVEREHQHVAA